MKLSADGHDGGGFLTVNHPSGKAALILSSTDFRGGIISNTSHGEILAAWPSKKSGEDGE